jgi:proline iminopeptidase
MKKQLSLKLLSCLPFVICLIILTVTENAQTVPVKLKHPPGNFVVVNGAKLWYESEGKGEPLLLIAGGPGSSHSYFHPFFTNLADSYRVIYFDSFGRGKSDRAKSMKEYTFDRDVEDVEGLRKALKLDKINLLGHSYGGMVAQAYALKYPNSIKKLILADTLYSGEMWQTNNDNYNNEIRNQYPEVWEKVQQLRMQGFQSGTKEHQAAYQVPSGLLYFYDASNADRATFEQNNDVYYTIAGADADFLIGGDIAKLDFRTQLKNLKMPTLIIAGRFDRVSMPKYALEFKRYAPQAQFVMFEKSGHLPFVEETAKTMDILRGFLSK